MSIDFVQAFGGGGKVVTRHSFPVTTSKSWTAPFDGVAVIRVMSAGGSGAKGSASQSGMGGFSGAWGLKTVRVVKGQVLTFVIGAGGAVPAAAAAVGIAGGASSVTIAGVTYSLAGGQGGAYAASGVPTFTAPPDLPAGWDFGAKSVASGAVSGGKTGGAGVDILAQGGNATTSAAVAGSGGGGTVSASLGLPGGGYLANGESANGSKPTAAGDGHFVDAMSGEWGVSFAGGSGTTVAGGNTAGNGGGGAGSTGASLGDKGGAGGGGGAGNGTSNAGAGGLGGGGGASINGGGAGGNGFAHIALFVESGG